MFVRNFCNIDFAQHGNIIEFVEINLEFDNYLKHDFIGWSEKLNISKRLKLPL